MALLRRAIDESKLAPSQCFVLADFADDVDFSQPAAVAEVIESTIELLEDAGDWHSIAVQGSSFPAVNPAAPDDDATVPRNEWRAWVSAVRFSKHTDERLVFGDYAADCAKINFDKSSGKPICHHRYTTPNDWRVVRGSKEGCNEVIMRNVCERIVGGGYFAGRSFSVADEFIYQTSKDIVDSRSATKWREVNTTHHITRVVRDMGAVKGMSFDDIKVEPDAMQARLFDEV